MQKYFLITCLLICLMVSSNAQISKGNWLVNGSADFLKYKVRTTDTDDPIKYNVFKISTLLGYFLKDKWALGIAPSLRFEGDNQNHIITLSIGPFVRYYFLKIDSKFNLFAQCNYDFEIVHVKHPNYFTKQNTFSLLAGPVLYLNKSIGVEFDMGYSISHYPGYSGYRTKMILGFGFQYHLEKE